VDGSCRVSGDKLVSRADHRTQGGPVTVMIARMELERRTERSGRRDRRMAIVDRSEDGYVVTRMSARWMDSDG
jgi:hypothetical protein